MGLRIAFRVFFPYNSNMNKKEISILGMFQKLFHNFNARQMKDATFAFKKHLDEGGKMLVAMGGAMSSAQIGVTLAPMIKEDKIHIISCTGANLEESIFRLVAHRIDFIPCICCNSFWQHQSCFLGEDNFLSVHGAHSRFEVQIWIR